MDNKPENDIFVNLEERDDFEDSFYKSDFEDLEDEINVKRLTEKANKNDLDNIIDLYRSTLQNSLGISKIQSKLIGF